MAILTVLKKSSITLILNTFLVTGFLEASNQKVSLNPQCHPISTQIETTRVRGETVVNESSFQEPSVQNQNKDQKKTSFWSCLPFSKKKSEKNIPDEETPLSRASTYQQLPNLEEDKGQ